MTLSVQFPDGLHPIGTKVYLPQPSLNNVDEDIITGYFCVMLNDEQGVPNVIPTDYRLTRGNLRRGTLESRWKDNEFFLSHEEAKAMAVKYEVNTTQDEWLEAIGLRGEDDENRTEYDDECELSSCCSVISGIRDILYEACLEGYLDGVTRKSLLDLLNQHEPAKEGNPALDKILAQLDIAWSGKTSPYVTILKK